MKQALQILDEALSPLYGLRERRNIAFEVLGHLLHTDRTRLLLMQPEPLSDDVRAEVARLAARLAQGEPLQYVTGEAWFCGMRLDVGPSVLIPRPETEELVEWILQTSDGSPRHMLDLGTGSGCIALALAAMRPQWSVEAVDISDDALRVARQNAAAYGLDIAFRRADILGLSCGEGGDFSLIVSNPPYIVPSEQKDMHRNVLEHEPPAALFVPESDPLLFYRHIARYAWQALQAGGSLFFEINRRYGVEVLSLLEQGGFVRCELRRDLSGNDRMVRAVKP